MRIDLTPLPTISRRMTYPDLLSFPDGFRAIVIGAAGGIGGAIYDMLSAHPRCQTVLGLSRNIGTQSATSTHLYIDLDDPASITAAADAAAPHGPFHLIISATGRLHGANLTPEKTWRHLDAEMLMSSYRANCIAPAMAAQHFLPLLAKDTKAAYGILSARVGSIGDNRIGGWHGYRAAKAGLNMMIRNFAIELAMKSPSAMVVGLHPGTVATPLSEPFRGKVNHDIFTPMIAAHHLLDVLDRATQHDSGHQLAWDGATIPA